MRGFLHCATHDEAVSGFGRNDAVWGLAMVGCVGELAAVNFGSGDAFAALNFDVDVDEAYGCWRYACDAAGLAQGVGADSG